MVNKDLTADAERIANTVSNDTVDFMQIAIRVELKNAGLPQKFTDEIAKRTIAKIAAAAIMVN